MSLPDPIPAQDAADALAPVKRTAGPVTRNATGVGGVAGALTTVLVWVLADFAHIDVPPAVATALGALLTAAGAWVGGWLVKPGTGKRVA